MEPVGRRATLVVYWALGTYSVEQNGVRVSRRGADLKEYELLLGEQDGVQGVALNLTLPLPPLPTPRPLTPALPRAALWASMSAWCVACFSPCFSRFPLLDALYFAPQSQLKEAKLWTVWSCRLWGHPRTTCHAKRDPAKPPRPRPTTTPTRHHAHRAKASKPFQKEHTVSVEGVNHTLCKTARPGDRRPSDLAWLLAQVVTARCSQTRTLSPGDDGQIAQDTVVAWCVVWLWWWWWYGGGGIKVLVPTASPPWLAVKMLDRFRDSERRLLLCAW